MKKILLTVFVLFSFLNSNSQSFTATNQYIIGDPLFFLEGHVTISNVSGSSKNVLVERTINNTATGHVSYFCWAQCYGSPTSLSPDPVTIPAGGDTSVFRGDLETNSIPGVSYVKYCFFDAANTGDSVCVDFIYDTSAGMSEIPANKSFISKPYPNPASDNASFFVNVIKGSKARIKIYNMIGSEVKDIAVADNTRGSVKINVSDLQSGIYFYSLYVNGKSTSTGKMMVRSN